MSRQCHGGIVNGGGSDVVTGVVLGVVVTTRVEKVKVVADVPGWTADV